MIQPPYNMFWRYPEKDEIPFCRTHDIGIVAYSALAQGLLTGKFTHQTRLAPDDSRLSTVLFQPGTYERSVDAVDTIQPIAEKYRKSLAQLAINWVISRPGISSALVEAPSTEQVEDNIGAVGWALSPEDYRFVDDATRAVFDALPDAKDMFFNWRNWELQRRRFEPAKPPQKKA